MSDGEVLAERRARDALLLHRRIAVDIAAAKAAESRRRAWESKQCDRASQLQSKLADECRLRALHGQAQIAAVHERTDDIEAERKARLSNVEADLSEKHQQAERRRAQLELKCQRQLRACTEKRVARSTSAQLNRSAQDKHFARKCMDVKAGLSSEVRVAMRRKEELHTDAAILGAATRVKDQHAYQKRVARDQGVEAAREVLAEDIDTKLRRACVPEARRDIEVRKVKHLRKEMTIQAHTFKQMAEVATFSGDFAKINRELDCFLKRSMSSPCSLSRPHSAHA